MPVAARNDPALGSLTGLHLYHANMSNCSMRVRMLLDEKGLPWESHLVDLRRGENIRDDYLKINPKGLVPALVHDGTSVTESNDIMFYIEERFPEPAFLPEPIDLGDQVREWVDLAANMHVKAIKTYIYDLSGGMKKSRSDMARYGRVQSDGELLDFHHKTQRGFQRDEIEAAVALLRDIFARMESRLSNEDWLVGEEISLADIAMAPQYVLLAAIGFDFRPYPAIVAWAERIGNRPAFDTAIRSRMPRIPPWLMRPLLRARAVAMNIVRPS